jgi:hypothetical protein
LNFSRIGPLEPASGHAAFIFAGDTDSLAIHPDSKIRQFAEFLNNNYVGIPGVPAEGGNGAMRKRDG